MMSPPYAFLLCASVAFMLQGCDDYCHEEGLIGPAYEDCQECVKEGEKKYGEDGGYKSICKQQALDKHVPFNDILENVTTQAFLRGAKVGFTQKEKQMLFSSLEQISATVNEHRVSPIEQDSWSAEEKQQLLQVLGTLVDTEKSNNRLLRSNNEGVSRQDSMQPAAWTVAEKENLLSNFGQLVDTEVQLVRAVENLSAAAKQTNRRASVTSK